MPKKSDTKIIRIDDHVTTLTLPKSECVVETTGLPSKTYTISRDTIRIGTASNNDIVIEDETVSRNHAEIIKDKQGYLIRDLGSTNGTFVGNVQIKEVYISAKSTIRVGQSKIRFHAQDEHLDIYPSSKSKFGSLIGQSMEMRKIFGILEKVAPTNVTVVIGGETGTGKELVARAIHENSKRNKNNIVIFDCGAVAENLIESELFGHEKGAFTGATNARQGAFELADNGTIFLDEIGELSLDLQPKLLRVLETGEIKRVGADRPKKVNVRVVCATHRNLKDMVAKGLFREDLYFRLTVVHVYLPPLRKRKEDVSMLVEHFFESAKQTVGGSSKIQGISPDVMEVLENHHWPGNIRELKNAIDRAYSFCDSDMIEISHLPEYLQGIPMPSSIDNGEDTSPLSSAPDVSMPFKDAKEKWIENFEKDYLIKLLKKNDLNISQAAKEAGIDRKSVQRLLKKYNLNVKDID
ncbi:MAG: sigma 54-interacting transcriptional regulator [Bdellovibrionales bacterium]|nr:sigma 54-interacting transcriptional regulator [Bdellovibrionales bacterium]